jgi:DNA-binding NtrC family response regulator
MVKRRRLADLLEHEGYETIPASRDRCPQDRIIIAAMLVDPPSYDTAQLTVVHSLSVSFPRTPMVILTGHDRDEQVLKALCRPGAWETIRKPYDSADLKQKLKTIIEKDLHS